MKIDISFTINVPETEDKQTLFDALMVNLIKKPSVPHSMRVAILAGLVEAVYEHPEACSALLIDVLE